MLNHRLKAALAVRDTYLPLKRNADQLAIDAARCVLTMQEQRREAGLRLGAGADAIADVSRGAALIAQGVAAIAEAHPKLAQLIEDSGLARFYPYQAMYGDEETPPNSPSGSMNKGLKLVG
jgi:outer membrane protein TolC